jgi:glycosyltransferase involved in cell wall biosynthesis
VKILHLGLEDHRRPGSGGGSLRNHEVNRRLALEHDVEVVTAAYPGCRPRVEDGVRYRHVGLPDGYAKSLLSYQAALPAVMCASLRRDRPDLVVEEFVPPWSSLAVGHWTALPTVGMVQGFFAAEKARQYHLPERVLTAIERFGTRSHRTLVAVSPDLARRLRAAAPRSHVVVVGNGVDRQAIADALEGHVPAPRTTPQIVFLGRLEIDQKGLDLLLRAFAALGDRLGARLVLAGDGRDRDAVARKVEELGLGGRVDLPGRVTGAAKWRLLADADVVAVPSRYETFGLTALEALACGTPVAGFDIDCLRDTVPARAGVLVAPFDVGAYAAALRELLADPRRRAAMGAAGREVAGGQDWDAIARAQAGVYREAVGG